MTLPTGSRLGPYEIVCAIGAGGMGEVYRARDPRLGRDVAIKVLPGSFSSDPDRLRRFEQEAKAAGVLNHPNITAVYDVGSQDGAPYVVSELLEGETLRARLAGGAFTPRKALGHALQIAHGLAAAHEKGIVHRDLKPENIFVTRDGRVKILDFGLAKLMQPEDSTRPQTDLPTVGSEPGVVLGTLGYMSPEQVRGKPADPRSDIFSFGAILYEMLSGQRAFRGDSAADTLSAILLKEPPLLSQISRDVPPGLDRVVRHCLEKNPEERFHSAHDLAFDLEALSDVSAPASPVQSVGWRAAWRARPMWLAVGLGTVLVGVAALVILRHPRQMIDSLAVLPFTSAGSDPSMDYLSDGITDELINSLSQLPNLLVMSRDSVSRYKGRDTSAQAAGRELNVQAVLKGKFTQQAENLLLTAELVDVRNNSHIWGGHLGRKLSNLQDLQEEIVRQISSRLRPGLTKELKSRLARRATDNPDAYQLYLKGRYAWEQRTDESLRNSIGFFNRAIEKDPAYALAYSGLADTYAISSINLVLAPRDSIPRAIAAAKRALEIDDGLSRPHATLGWCLFSYDWNYPAAEAEFRAALALDPNDPTAHQWYGFLLSALGRSDEAIAALHRAAKMDPLSGVIQVASVRVLVYARQFDNALEEARKAVDSRPNWDASHAWLGQVYEAKGLLREALSEFQKANSYVGIARVDARSGKRGEAQERLDDLKRLSTQRYVPPLDVARVYRALGDNTQAFEWMEKAYADHSANLVFLNVNPEYDDLRSDPRFADLLRRLHLAS